MEVSPMNERAKKLVKVITPMPPTCIRSRMMICPAAVNWVATSTVVSPVTQTDVVAVKRASTKCIPWMVALGSISNPVPVRITKAKLKINNSDGLMRC